MITFRTGELKDFEIGDMLVANEARATRLGSIEESFPCDWREAKVFTLPAGDVMIVVHNGNTDGLKLVLTRFGCVWLYTYNVELFG